MAILEFQQPDKVIMLDSTDYNGKFEFRPLEPGFGLTVGNALRRILLSSLEGLQSPLSALRVRITNSPPSKAWLKT
jgi:DNA-directed RNA polymerase subunit alpha